VNRGHTFNPTVLTILRILHPLLENGSMTRTDLSRGAKINYSVFKRYFAWLRGKGLVELAMEEEKITVRITKKGRDLALILNGNSTRQ
jgi:predicted transcriptional regulator